MFPTRVRTTAPVVASQIFAVLSQLPVMTREPSALNDAEASPAICPLNDKNSALVLASQTFEVWSTLLVKTCDPSGWNDTEVTG